MDSFPFNVRAGEIGDVQFIYNSWIRAVGACSPWRELDKNWFSAAQTALIHRLLSRSRVLVACDVEDSDQIYGYIVYEPAPSVAHWLYVKQMFRGAGIGTALVRESAVHHGSTRVRNSGGASDKFAKKLGIEVHTKWLLGT